MPFIKNIFVLYFCFTKTIARHLSHDSTVDYQYPNQRVQYPEHTLVQYPPPYTVQPTVPAPSSTIPMQSQFTGN